MPNGSAGGGHCDVVSDKSRDNHVAVLSAELSQKLSHEALAAIVGRAGHFSARPMTVRAQIDALLSHAYRLEGLWSVLIERGWSDDGRPAGPVNEQDEEWPGDEILLAMAAAYETALGRAGHRVHSDMSDGIVLVQALHMAEPLVDGDRDRGFALVRAWLDRYAADPDLRQPYPQGFLRKIGEYVIESVPDGAAPPWQSVFRDLEIVIAGLDEPEEVRQGDGEGAAEA
jgi:hypothetical protein